MRPLLALLAPQALLLIQLLREGKEAKIFPSTKPPQIHLQQLVHQSLYIGEVSGVSQFILFDPKSCCITLTCMLYFFYRSLLADVIQPQDVKALCSVLVAVAGEAAKALTGETFE